MLIVFCEGLAGVEINRKWGFINTRGVITIPCSFDEVSKFSGGLTKVKQNKKYGFINKEGLCFWED